MDNNSIAITLYLTCTLLFSTFLYHSVFSELCNPEDKKALLDIKQGFNNPQALSTWDPQSDCCVGWESMHCDDKTHRVTAVFVLQKGDLAGPIPTQFGDLPYLEVIEINQQPNVTGPIPPAILKLQALRFVTITMTSLSGPVPDFLSEIKTLEEINLSFNNLTGPIPASLSSLPHLKKLRLYHNGLTGPIPDSFGDFPPENYIGLQLNDNDLSGTIPASLAKMDFTLLDISGNRLEGDASLLLWPNKTAGQIVILSRNLFEFDISKVHKFSRMMTWLDLSQNKISGRLSKGLVSLEFLFYFNVSYNRLCGKIPVGGKLQKLDYTSFFHNRCLCGAPLEIACK